MASLVWCVMVLYLYFAVSHGTQVQWSISLPGKCVTNDTIVGLCSRSRTVQCVKTLTGQVVPDYYCNEVATKPSSFIKCDTQKCPGRCVVSMWSSWQPCDSVCSRKFSYRTRSVLWRDDDAVTCPPLLEKATCAQCAGNANDFYFWNVNDWGACRAFTTSTVYELSANQSRLASAGNDVCGPNLKIGKATRKVECLDTNGVEQELKLCLNSKDKDGRTTQRPDRSKVCLLPCDCHVTAWSAWSGCPADCSRMEESRTRGVLYPPQLGGKACGPLVEKRSCSTKCPIYSWYKSPWSKCGSDGDLNGTHCGESYKKRVVFCVQSNAIAKASEIQPVADHLCDVAIKPAAWQRCQIPCPQDCVVSSWNAWEPCPVSCGSAGVKKRTRSVVQAAENGGAECPSLIQMAPCVVPCAAWKTFSWRRCFATGDCGRGMMSRVVYCRELSGGWASNDMCAGKPQPPRVKNCTVPCPNDCVLSEWGFWGACSKSCGRHGGVQIRKRSILAYPSSLRLACPTGDKLTETRKCNEEKPCEDDVTYMWKTSTWGPCEGNVTDKCGADEGVQTREVYCGNDVKNFENDTQCGNITKPHATRQCDLPCPKDCVLSKWKIWSRCNATCHLQGIEVSKRYVVQQAEHGGSACPTGMTSGIEVKTRPCWNSQPCYNYTWSVTPWQECVILPSVTPSPCGAGYQIRNISCVRSDGKLAETSYCFEANLELPPKSLKECWKPCGDDCVRTSWSEWSECPNKCSSTVATRDRTRQVVNLTPGRGGFSGTCPRLTDLDFVETEDCSNVPCGSYKWFAAPFTSCIPRDNASGCGQGMKERHVFCQDQSDSSFVAESFCDGLKKPSAWENCVIECTQDCVVSSWGKWDLDCSRTCGDTLKTRQRVILQQPKGLGRSCPSLVDRQLCHEAACTSFKWNVGIWNTCELGSQGGICGNGTQTREVVCSPDPNREWICEKQAPKPIEIQECSLACPGDCVEYWTPWSECAQGRDECLKARWKLTMRQAHTTSLKKCSPTQQLIERVNCSCPSEGMVVASDWTTCTLNQTLGTHCGKGMQHRSVKCEDNNGTVLEKERCPNYDAVLRSRDCEIPCPVDCVMGDWGEWSSCTPACGLNSKIQRSRPVIVSEQNGGRKCPEATQFRPCDSIPCYNYSLNLGAWGKCYVDGRGCGDGSQSRETTCHRSDGQIVSLHFCYGQLEKSMDDTARLQVLRDAINNSSQLKMTSLRRCDVSCPDDCFMSDWSEWSECGRNCFGNSTKYYQTRTRVVISSPNAGGKACSTDLLQTQECQPMSTSSLLASECLGAQWRSGPWQANGTRAVWCETSSGVRVTGACAEQQKPSETKSCNPPCLDSNSICDEGRCQCKPNYELFQRQCIPTQGCLGDGHCINDRNVCKNEKCTCGVGYSWNTTSESCVLVPKTFADKPTTVSTARETTSTKRIPTTADRTTVVTTVLTNRPEVTTVLTNRPEVTTKSTEEVKRTSTVETSTDNAKKEAVDGEEGTISPEFWKWIGIGIGALVFFLVLAIGFYCYSARQRKAKHRMMKLKRNTIELVGILTFGEDEKLKPDKV